MHTLAYWSREYTLRREQALKLALFNAVIAWELNKYHDVEDAYYRAKFVMKEYAHAGFK